MDTDNFIKKTDFLPELKKDSFNIHNIPVKYRHGRFSVVGQLPTDPASYGAPKSRWHEFIARILTPIVTIFESYDFYTCYTEDPEDLGVDFNGITLKNRIVNYTKNLNEVKNVILQKEKEIEKWKKDTKRASYYEGMIKANQEAIQDIQKDWKFVKSNLEGLQNGLKDTYFNGSTILIRLKRAERGLEDAFSRNVDLPSPPKKEEVTASSIPQSEGQESPTASYQRFINGIFRPYEDLLEEYDREKEQPIIDKIYGNARDFRNIHRTNESEIQAMIDEKKTIIGYIQWYRKERDDLKTSISSSEPNKFRDAMFQLTNIKLIVNRCKELDVKDDPLLMKFQETIKKDLLEIKNNLTQLNDSSSDAKELLANIEHILADLNAPRQSSI